MVSYVSGKHEMSSNKIEIVFRNIERISRGFLRYILGEESLEISDLIKENEVMLEKLGVVSSLTKRIVRKIEKLGGLPRSAGLGVLVVRPVFFLRIIRMLKN